MKVKRIYAVTLEIIKNAVWKLLQWSISFMGKMLREKQIF